MTGKPKRVACYCRVSTTRQVVQEAGSLDTQEDLLRRGVDQKVAAGENWTVTKVYREEAASGKNLNRPKFQEMLADIEAGLIDVVAAVKIDRASRNVRDFLGFVDYLNEKGVAFFCIHQQIDTSTPIGKLIVTFLIALAEWERAVCSERAKVKSQWRAEQGLWHGGAQLLGYRSARGSIEPVPEERGIVEAMFQEYLRTNSLRRTAKALTELGYRRKKYTSRRGSVRGGNVFTMKHVHLTLTNPVYISKLRHNNELYDGKHEPIIDEKLFEEVQRRLKHNGVQPVRKREKPKYIFLLDGLLKCACGSSLTPSWSRGRGKDYRYYTCTKHQQTGACSFGRVNADLVESAIAARLITLSQDPKLLSAVLAASDGSNAEHEQVVESELRRQRQRLQEVDGRLTNLVEFLANGGEAQSVRKKLAELEAQRDQLNRRVADAKDRLRELKQSRPSPEQVSRSLDFFAKAYEQAGPEQRRQLFQLMIDHAVYTDARITMALFEVGPPTGPPDKDGDEPPPSGGARHGEDWLADMRIIRTGAVRRKPWWRDEFGK